MIPRFVTTLGRVDDQVTLKQVAHCTLVVQAHEEAAHRATWPDHEILVLPPEVRTIGATRRHMCTAPGLPRRFFLLDDDLTISVRRVPGDYHLKTATKEEVEQMFVVLEQMLENYAHVAVSPREGQNRFPDTPVENVRYMRLVGYNLDLFPSGLDIGRVNCMSDFDLALQLLQAGRPSITLTKWAQGHKATQQPGGCSTQRTLESHNAEVRRMAELYPGIVKVRQKDDKTGGAFGKRMEVTIGWKKAYRPL